MPKNILISLSLPFLALLYLPKNTYAAECDYIVGSGETYSTIQSAVDKAKSDGPYGKTVCVKDNKTYIERVSLNNIKASVDKPFTLKKHPSSNSKPKIKDTDPYTKAGMWKPIIGTTASQHIIVQGLEVERSSGGGAQVTDSDSVLYKDLTVHNVFMRGIRVQGSNKVVIDSCEVYEAGIADSPTCRDVPGCNTFYSNFPETVNMSFSTNSTIKNCTIHNVYGNSLSSVRTYNTSILNNTVYDTEGHSLLHLDQANKVVFENNLAYNTGATNRASAGAYKLDEYYTTKLLAGDTSMSHTKSWGFDVQIKNNIFVNSRNGINIGKCENKPGLNQVVLPPCRLEDYIILNNTVLNVEEYSFRLREHDTSFGNIVANNIFHVSNDGSDSILQTKGVNFNTNIWSKTPPNIKMDASSRVLSSNSDIKNLFKDPAKILNNNLVKPGKLDPLWFELKAAYKEYGADASKVGPKGSSATPTPTPTQTPTPTSAVTPTPQYDSKYDLNNDGKVTVMDVIEVIKYVFQ